MNRKMYDFRVFQKLNTLYGVMRDPKSTTSKNHVRMSPEVFLTRESAQAYIDESRRRGFLSSDYLVVVEMHIIGGELGVNQQEGE